MIAKTMTPEQALEWLEGLRNTPGDQVCDEIEAGKAAKAAQIFRDILEAARNDVVIDAVLEEAARACEELDEEALCKEGRLASGHECAAAIRTMKEQA